MRTTKGEKKEKQVECESEMLHISPPTKNAKNSWKAGENDDFTVIKQGVRRKKIIAGSTAR